jgi:hypothetical protein
MGLCLAARAQPGDLRAVRTSEAGYRAGRKREALWIAGRSGDTQRHPVSAPEAEPTPSDCVLAAGCASRGRGERSVRGARVAELDGEAVLLGAPQQGELQALGVRGVVDRRV